LATALVAGGYPSFYVTSFEPVSILKGTTRFGGTNLFTRILLGGQFIISLLAIIMGVAFLRNGQYQRDYDLGFTTKGVIAAWVNNENGYNTYRDALSSNTDIEVLAGTKHHIANAFFNDPVKHEGIEREVDIMEVGDQYLEAMDVKLLSGRAFQKDSETDKKESVLVTEELVRKFGWADDPIGKRLVWNDTVSLYVIGVVRNIYARALWQPIEPMMMRYVGPDKYQQVIVRTSAANVSKVNAFMEKKWKEIFPNTMYNGQMIESELQETNEINANVVTMFGFLGFFATLMTAIGVYTLVSLNIVRRMKEIGVRKVLGASVLSIAGVINKQFLIILLIAMVIGSGLGLYTANMLMSSIWTYYLTAGLLVILFSVALLGVLALTAAGFKSIRTAAMNPTNTLRDE
ncbi:MAG: ABC transporter permease, partial [Cyclobacteriaceae bacterium]|nr:ABC transporter permease [Cyclobacteriaceae bacterium]